MLAALCHEIYVMVLPHKLTDSRVPRCLFGKPDPKETAEIFQEAMENERRRFMSRWEIIITSENKENNYQRHTNRKNESVSNKKRSSPYAKQTNIHDYWRFRKASDVNKVPLASLASTSNQQNIESPRTMKTTANLVTTSTTQMTTTAPTTTMKTA